MLAHINVVSSACVIDIHKNVEKELERGARETKKDNCAVRHIVCRPQKHSKL
jgi:hypothetical protein